MYPYVLTNPAVDVVVAAAVFFFFFFFSSSFFSSICFVYNQLSSYKSRS